MWAPAEETVFRRAPAKLHLVILGRSQCTHNCERNKHNTGSKCQTPRHLDRQTRQSMFQTVLCSPCRKQIFMRCCSSSAGTVHEATECIM